jgi:hypothetical protein
MKRFAAVAVLVAVCLVAVPVMAEEFLQVTSPDGKLFEIPHSIVASLYAEELVERFLPESHCNSLVGQEKKTCNRLRTKIFNNWFYAGLRHKGTDEFIQVALHAIPWSKMKPFVRPQ